MLHIRRSVVEGISKGKETASGFKNVKCTNALQMTIPLDQL